MNYDLFERLCTQIERLAIEGKNVKDALYKANVRINALEEEIRILKNR